MKNPLQFFDPATGEIMRNSLGYQQVISTLTAVSAKLSDQRFYEIAPADYMPVVVGNGAYQRQILNWRTFVTGEGFESGIISNASQNAQLASTDASFDGLTQNILSWAKSIRYNLFELQEALQANSLFSLIEAREMARRKEWQLGVQKLAFNGIGAETGLLNNANAQTDNTTISKRLASMSASEFNTFVGALYQAYRSNCAYTAKPTHFVIPEKDYNSLVQFPDATYPLRTRLSILLEAFQLITNKPDFKILPLAYADKAYSPGTTYNFYVLLNYDPTSLKLDLPLDYIQTTAGSSNGFTWENVAYGQFTGVIMQRPLETLYFTNTAT